VRPFDAAFSRVNDRRAGLDLPLAGERLIMDPEMEVLPDESALTERVASWLITRARAKRSNFVLALSGGSTPKALYRLLAELKWAGQMPWQRLQLVWGDERFVPSDHPDSNYRMVRETMLDHVPIPAENVHPIPTSGSPDEAARSYERTLRRLYGSHTLELRRPLFDVVLLGLGDDGHTASLFPGVQELDERLRWVVPIVGVQPQARISLTYPALNSSAATAFLVAGVGKRRVLQRLKLLDPALPASGIEPVGALHVFCDMAAASAWASP
jgi:6-phosphogluconolactonase